MCLFLPHSLTFEFLHVNLKIIANLVCIVGSEENVMKHVECAGSEWVAQGVDT